MVVGAVCPVCTSTCASPSSISCKSCHQRFHRLCVIVCVSVAKSVDPFLCHMCCGPKEDPPATPARQPQQTAVNRLYRRKIKLPHGLGLRTSGGRRESADAPKSVSVLCRSFLGLYTDGEKFTLPSTLKRLGEATGFDVEKRRFYDLIHVMHSVFLVDRVDKSSYVFAGWTNMIQKLISLQQDPKRSEAEAAVEGTAEKSPMFSQICRNFVRFLMLNELDGKSVTPEMALDDLNQSAIGDENSRSARRLYDIAGILAGLGLIAKVSPKNSGVMNRGYLWIGPSISGRNPNFPATPPNSDAVIAPEEPSEPPTLSVVTDDDEPIPDSADDDYKASMNGSADETATRHAETACHFNLRQVRPRKRRFPDESSDSSSASLQPTERFTSRGRRINKKILLEDYDCVPEPRVVKHKKSPVRVSDLPTSSLLSCGYHGCSKVYTCAYTLNRHRKLKHSHG